MTTDLILKMTPKAEFSVVAEYDGWPYGLKIHKDGRFFVTDYKCGLLQLDPGTGEIQPVLKHHTPRGLRGANDLVFDRKGNLYFTDYGQSDLNDPSGRVYRLNADGRLDLLSGVMPGPNGIVLDAAENLLYVAATRGNEIWRFNILPDGAAIKATVFARSGGGVGPDGMAIDEAGNLFVAHAGLGIVWGYNRRGELIYRIESPVGQEITNLAFGGPERKTLYMLEAEGHILTVDLPDAGVLMYSHT